MATGGLVGLNPDQVVFVGPSIPLTNNKVLLRERKRQTARRVASARYAALSPDGGIPEPDLYGEGGTPSSPGWAGTPSSANRGRGYSIQSQWGEGVPHPALGEGTPG